MGSPCAGNKYLKSSLSTRPAHDLVDGAWHAAAASAAEPAARAQNCTAVPYVNMMKKDEDAAASVREAVAGLWRKGAALAWDVPAGPVAGTLFEYLPQVSKVSMPKAIECKDCWSAYSLSALHGKSQGSQAAGLMSHPHHSVRVTAWRLSLSTV